MRKLKLTKHKSEGKLIVFEGTDGAGKTTLINMTQKFISDFYGTDNVLCVKQPTDLSRKTKLFQKMMYCSEHSDIDYRAVQLLTMSDRIQHTYEVIAPALREGKTVICDRYIYTSLANMLARGYANEDWFFAVAKHLILPDYVFLAHVKPEIAISRIKARPEEKNKYLNEELLYKVEQQFIRMAKREKFHVLDTNKKAEETFMEIKKILFVSEESK